jgi:hypothetical protein
MLNGKRNYRETLLRFPLPGEASQHIGAVWVGRRSSSRGSAQSRLGRCGGFAYGGDADARRRLAQHEAIGSRSFTARSVTIRSTGRVEASGSVHSGTIFGTPLAV